MNDIVETKRGYASVPMHSDSQGGSLVPQTLGDVVDFAKIMSRASIALPKHLRENDGACMAVAMQAFRWQMDPFAVANKTYSVNDRLAYEAQLVAAVINMRAPISKAPIYSYSGDGPTRRCKVTCHMKDGETREYETPMFSQITVKNSPLWKSDPDQQLGYFAIRSWGRRYAPEVILGVYDRDEIAEAEPLNITPKANAGMAERLAAKADTRPQEGFNAVTGEIIDAEVEDIPNNSQTASEDAPPSEATSEQPGAATTAEADDEGAADIRMPESFDAEYLEDWQAAIKGALQNFKGAKELREFWSDPETATRYAGLKYANPGLAKELVTAMNTRLAEIKNA
jgi:hypothetical protein